LPHLQEVHLKNSEGWVNHFDLSEDGVCWCIEVTLKKNDILLCLEYCSIKALHLAWSIWL
jgi:hypothetical protein